MDNNDEENYQCTAEFAMMWPAIVGVMCEQEALSWETTNYYEKLQLDLEYDKYIISDIKQIMTDILNLLDTTSIRYSDRNHEDKRKELIDKIKSFLNIQSEKKTILNIQSEKKTIKIHLPILK